jgi:hypothetical protein
METRKSIAMTVPGILKALEPYTGRFLMEAMRAAIHQREAITPELLRIVEAMAANPAEVANRQDYIMLPVCVLYFARLRLRGPEATHQGAENWPQRPMPLWQR